MTIPYFEISYPNFVLNQIIDPNHANQNNHDITEKLNEIIGRTNMSAITVDRVNEELSTHVVDVRAHGLGEKEIQIGEDSQAIGENSIAIGYNTRTVGKESVVIGSGIQNNHDYIIILGGEEHTVWIRGNVLGIDKSDVGLSKVLNVKQASKVEFDAHNHDDRYYTKDEIAPLLDSGNLTIYEDIYTIINPDKGDGTFTYEYVGHTHWGNRANYLGPNGEQLFTLVSGSYEPNMNHVEVYINDTLRRTARSGGIVELDPNLVQLTEPEGAGTKITIRYYGLTGE